MILACQYGLCPADTSPENAPKSASAIACIFPSNEGVDNFSAELRKMYEKLGFGANMPIILRLYGMDSEIATMLNKAKDKPKDSFDAAAAAEEMASFDLSDYLTAEFQIVKLSAESFDAEKMARTRKNRLRHMSLHAHAYHWLDQNRSEYPELCELLELIDAKHPLSDVQATFFKGHTRVLYQDFLAQFTGIICATPVAASHSSVRGTFRPELVVIDENARMRELSTLIPIAWYNPKVWVILGDPRQLKPHVSLDVDGNNMFRPSLETSILSRATEAGAVSGHLSVNFRQYGDLVDIPSRLCYLGEMVDAHEEQYTGPVNHWISHLKSVHPGHPGRACRLLVEMPGSRTCKVGNSTGNRMHARWVFEQVEAMLANKNLTGEGKNRGKPARILLLPLYRAQFRQYEVELAKLRESRKFTEDQLARIRIQTLDSSQGDEDDIVITDLAQTDEPGFTGDLHRICLMLTRPVIGHIILMEKGMWLCSDKNKSIATRASFLRALYRLMAASNVVHTVKCCDRCETFNTHMTAKCPERTRKDGQTEECSNCGDKKTHCGTIETCHIVTTCDNCKEKGHTSNECEKETKCYRCNSKEHICYECTVNVVCVTCRSWEHLSFQCPDAPIVCKVCGKEGHIKAQCPDQRMYGACHNCNETGHIAKDCPQPKKDTRKCKTCGKLGHLMATCPDSTCLKCKQQGHIAATCPNKRVKTCARCGEPGHLVKTCSTKPLQCTVCGGFGHVGSNCTGPKDRRGPRLPGLHDLPQDMDQFDVDSSGNDDIIQIAQFVIDNLNSGLAEFTLESGEPDSGVGWCRRGKQRPGLE